jgi:hypothetical protein
LTRWINFCLDVFGFTGDSLCKGRPLRTAGGTC